MWTESFNGYMRIKALSYDIMYTFHQLTNEDIQNSDANCNKTSTVSDCMQQISKLFHFKYSSQDSKEGSAI